MRWQKEKDPLAPRGASYIRTGALLPMLSLVAALLTVFSFFLFRDEGGTGDVSHAVSGLEEFFSENDAVAVFLGWEGEGD